MSDSDDLTRALHRLRAAVREQVPAPASAAVRAAATRQQRVRRTAIAALAATAVAVVAFGGAAVLQPSAGQRPAPPAGPPSSEPTESPEPNESPTQPTPEPFADVDWREATIDVPPHDGCPSGLIDLHPATGDGPEAAMGPADDSFPRLYLYVDLAAYGDLTGDGRAEAVLGAYCRLTEEASGDGEGQLLAISRDGDGSLRGIGWVGPRGAVYQSAWITDGALYVEAHPWHGDGFEWAPGVALRYQWDGTGFGGYEWAPEYPPILPADEAETGPPVRLGPVATGLGCPDGTVRFGRAGTATLDGVTYDLTQPSVPSSGPHLLDLDRTGDRPLLLAIECEGTRGLGVFERTAAGFEGISVLVPSIDFFTWHLAPRFIADRRIALNIDEATYEWNGSEFEAVS